MSETLTDDGIILNIDKPAEWTSFDVVKKIRSELKIRKVGHTGTLDPFATGVLVVCVGQATKKIEALTGCDKEYLASIELGIQTDTHDMTGNVVNAIKNWQHLSENDIIEACRPYQGAIFQIPPMFSALKVRGKRLYQYARKGIIVKRKPRPLQIYSIDVEHVDLPLISLRIVCSKGTYIRAFARDIGKDLQCGAYLKSLRRTKVGHYHIKDAMTIDDFMHKYSVEK